MAFNFKKKKSNYFKIIFFLILLIILNTSCTNEEKKSENIEKTDKNNKQNTIFTKEENTKLIFEKIDKNKEIVYTKNFFEDFEPKFYSYTENGNTNIINLDDCKLPFINLNCEGAEEINNEIQKYIDENVKVKFKDAASNSWYFDPSSTYSYSINDKFLSIVIENKINDKVKDYSTIITFNLNLETGKRMKIQDALKITSSKEHFLDIMEEKINKFYDEYTDLKNKENFYSNDLVSKLKSKSLLNLWEDYYANKTSFYFDDAGQLSVLYKLCLENGIKKQEKTTININDEIDNLKLNPISKKLDFSKNDNFLCGIAFLGQTKNTNQNINLEEFNFFDSETFFKNQIVEEYKTGKEIYYIFSKYENGVILLNSAKNEDDGNVVFDDNWNVQSSNTFVVCNQNELKPDLKVKVIYRNELIEFSPYLSLEKEKPITVDGLKDFTDEINELR